MTSKFATYQKKLEIITSQYTREIDILADDIKTKIVIPYCDKHGLTFFCGMGMFLFVDKQTEEVHTPIGYIHDILTMETIDSHYIHEFMSEYQD